MLGNITFTKRQQFTHSQVSSLTLRFCSHPEIYRGTGFLAVLWFGSSQTSPPLFRQQGVSFPVFLCVSGRTNRRWRGRGARGTKSYDSEKAWSSIIHSILFGWEQIRSGCYLVSPHHKYMKYSFLMAWTITAQILFWLLVVSSDLRNWFFMFLMSVQLVRFKDQKLIFYRKKY